VTGGSHAYVKAFQKQFPGTIRLATPVRRVRRAADGVWLTLDAGDPELRFDGVVMAAHADESFAMLADPDAVETRLLGPWRYERNRVVLHSDPTALPPVRRAWASWNYVREEAGAQADLKPVSVTYYMNRLQGLQTRKDYCVSLNRRRPIAPECIVRELEYMHPTYSFASMATQAELPKLNGRRQTWFCGSYFSYGFHEDAVRSAVAVGRDLGLEL
jgi:predicted NAD/FAD-binding protein